MPLTDTAVRSAKPREKAYKLTDGAGLYLEVMPTGARYWRKSYRFAGKDSGLASGVYPEVSVAEAGKRRDSSRLVLREGRDPATERKSQRLQAALAAVSTCEAVAREFLKSQRRRLAPSTFAKSEWLLKDQACSRTYR